MIDSRSGIEPKGAELITNNDAPLGYDDAAAAPLSETELAARTGIVLPDSAADLARIIDTALAKLARTELAAESETTVLAVTETAERARRRLDAVAANLYLECSDRTAYRQAGYLTMPMFVSQGLRLGRGEARRRSTLALRLPRHTALTGERLDPVMPATADAVADGVIGAPHALIIAETLKKLPDQLGPDIHASVERDLVSFAAGLNPRDLERAAAHVLAHLDPDGTLTDPDDRQRQRGLWILAQDQQLMTKISGRLTPAARAKFELILDKYAAPGRNNPEDPNSPHGAAVDADQASEDAAREKDGRTPDQRMHDAFEAMCDFLIAHHGLGAPGPLPTELVITVSDEDLARQAGVALTTTGTLIPVADLIRLAAENNPNTHLAVFRHHTKEPLYLGRGKRLASKSQRLMMFARDGGCTAPACDVPFNRTQAHHAPDWAKGGKTNVDTLGSACGGHNRWVGPKPGQWTTATEHYGPDAGRIGWTPSKPAANHGPGQATEGGPVRRVPAKLNPMHRPNLTNPNAPPAATVRGSNAQANEPNTADPVAANDARSLVQKALEARLDITFLTA